MTSQKELFLKQIRQPVKSRVFLFFKLPSAFFSGIRIRSVSETHCDVSVPYKWFTQNPFRSTYFACLSMAAELSTGALAMASIAGSKAVLSMLVVKVESEYFKKATTKTIFSCHDGSLFDQAITECIATGDARSVTARSVGKNSNGDIIAEFFITWSFKVRK